jgi:hypothetical protein
MANQVIEEAPARGLGRSAARRTRFSVSPGRLMKEYRRDVAAYGAIDLPAYTFGYHTEIIEHEEDM